MAGWGAMMGLGQALQQVGGMLGDYNKTKMREKLEIEREDRQVQRERDKEQRALRRELTTPTEWRPTQDDSGNTYLQAFNSHGKPIQGESRPMSKYEAEEFARKQRLGELEVEGKEQTVANQGLEGQLKGFQVRDYDEEKRLKRRQVEASIESSLASAQASRSRAMNSGRSGNSRDSSTETPKSDEELALQLVKEYGSVVEEYALSKDNPGGLTPTEINRLARDSVRAAADRKVNARTVFREALQKLVDKKAARNK